MVQLRGQVYQNHCLAPYTSWKIGGPAKTFFQPADLLDLKLFLQQAPTIEKIYWLGAGSNVLIYDAGINGSVIYLKDRVNQIDFIADDVLRVEAGVFCPKFANYCKQNALVDGAFLIGIPGTIGGALAMNAGAFGSEIWNYVVAVETINHRGAINIRRADEFNVSYRHVDLLANEWFVAGHFSFAVGDYAFVEQKVGELMRQRHATQPLGEYSCGSVFRNPVNGHAGKLIEQCGLKGKKIGGAKISEKHANFIINTGNSTAEDVLRLIAIVQQQVQDNFGVLLEPEVRLIGQQEKWDCHNE